jgi:hypothetical protein
METWNKKKGHGEPEDNSKPFLYGERRLYMIDLIDCLDSNL